MTYQYEDGASLLDVMCGLIADGGNFNRARFLDVLYAHVSTIRSWGVTVDMEDGYVTLDMALLRDGSLAVLASRNGKVIDYHLLCGAGIIRYGNDPMLDGTMEKINELD